MANAVQQTEELLGTDKRSLVVELLEALEEIEEEYKYTCLYEDDVWQLEQSLMYQNGRDHGLDIDGLTWHKISLILRKLKEEEE